MNLSRKKRDALIFRLKGAGMAGLNDPGHGRREKTYEPELCVAFDPLGINLDQQLHEPVYFREVKIDEYIPDLELEGLLLLDIKFAPNIGNIELGQMLHFLKVSHMPVGLIQNFKHPKLEWRVV
jgi:GxxExxY protein|tara:strand:+ start:161 stop:532 length:372 start_codon:yes stop_codon:yes gene_type:complete